MANLESVFGVQDRLMDIIDDLEKRLSRLPDGENQKRHQLEALRIQALHALATVYQVVTE